MAILDLWIWTGNVRGQHIMAYIGIGEVGGIRSALTADARNVVRCETGRVPENAILVLVSRKADPFFLAISFSWSYDRLV